MSRRLSISLVFILVCLALLPVASGQSGSALWTDVQELGPGWWNSVAVDLQGTAHIAWYGSQTYGAREAPPGTDFLTYAARTLEGDWRGPVDAIYTGDGGFTVRNALAAGPDGTLYAALRGQTNHFFTRSHVDMATVASSWSPPELMAEGYYLDLIVDDAGVLHMVNSVQGVNMLTVEADTPISLESDPCAFCADILYRRSPDGGNNWSSPINISNTWGGSEKVDVWQGPSGRLYINWDEGFDWYIGRGNYESVRFVYSEDGGLTWSDPVILEGEGLATRRPMQLGLTELEDGSLLAVWRYSDDIGLGIYYQLSTDLGATWTDPETIDGIYARALFESPLDDYELILDHTGAAHLFLTARPNPERDSYNNLYHVEYRQGRWLPPEVVFAGERDIWPEWPKAAIGPQNQIHLTWFNRYVRRTESGFDPTAGLRVFYAYRPPTLTQRPTQVFLPTATPLAVAAVQREFAPTATSFPEVGPLEPVNVRTTNDLYAIQTLLAALGAGVLLSLGVLAVVGFRPRLRR